MTLTSEEFFALLRVLYASAARLSEDEAILIHDVASYLQERRGVAMDGPRNFWDTYPREEVGFTSPRT